jgi:hypothetical protein
MAGGVGDGKMPDRIHKFGLAPLGDPDFRQALSGCFRVHTLQKLPSSFVTAAAK